MSFHSLSICLSLLFFNSIFSPFTLLVTASAAGKLNLYDDYNCNTPSILNPSVTLPLSTCLVTTGGEGLVIGSTPPCPQGTATLIYYQDPACGVQTTDVSTSIGSSSCFQLAAGTDLFVAKSVMFSCQPAANNPQPSSTSTAVVSGLAAVATGSDQSGSGSGSSSSPTGASAQPSSTGGGGSSSSTTINNNSSPSSSSGLQTGDIIAIAVGLGIGIPTILIMLATWLMPNFRHKLRDWFLALRRKLTPWASPQQQQQQHDNTPRDFPQQQLPYNPPGRPQRQHRPHWQQTKSEMELMI